MLEFAAQVVEAKELSDEAKEALAAKAAEGAANWYN